MNQIEQIGNQIILRVKKRSILLTGTLFIVAFVLMIMPVIATVGLIITGNGFHILGGVFAVVFILSGFYMLRMALWNSKGADIITIEENQINYIADYGWFKDASKTVHRNGEEEFSFAQLGYEEDQVGGLVIRNSEKIIQCSAQLPLEILENLAEELNKKWKS